MIKIEHIAEDTEYDTMEAAEQFLNKIGKNNLINISFVALDKSDRMLTQSDIQCIIVYNDKLDF